VRDVSAPGAAVRAYDEDHTALAGRAREAGIANDLVVTGAPTPEQAQARLAVNRIVRECLTNAGRHAPGRPVTIEVAWGEREVRVCASNAAASNGAPTPGRGLTGMRHRAELLGGTFEAVHRDGRFDVHVAMPLAAEVSR
jgi:signal transduction histidine kinase